MNSAVEKVLRKGDGLNFISTSPPYSGEHWRNFGRVSRIEKWRNKSQHGRVPGIRQGTLGLALALGSEMRCDEDVGDLFL
jgi:hypothetical protein